MGHGSGQTIKHTIEYNYDKHCNQDRGLFQNESWRTKQGFLEEMTIETGCVKFISTQGRGNRMYRREELVEPRPGELEGEEWGVWSDELEKQNKISTLRVSQAAPEGF